jgi:hypothetical protein
MYSIGNCYQATTGKDPEGLVHAVMNCRVCELAIVLQLIVVMVCKHPINLITHPNPVCSHLTHENVDNMFPVKSSTVTK